MSRQRVEPRLPRGMQDHPPALQAMREHVIDVARGVYERYGFQPLSTPAIEYREVLVGPGGTEANQSIFDVDAREDDELGLRFDHTVPFARFVAANQQDLPRPFRRYQVGPVWRVDKPGPGRFREFVQCDADVVGTQNPLADAEVVAALRDVFAEILPTGDGEPPRFRLRVSDRRLLDALVARIGEPAERGPDVFRVLDKLDRIGLERVCLECREGYVDDSGAKIPGLGLGEEAVALVREFLALGGATRRETLDAVAAFLGEVRGADVAVEAVGRFLELLDAHELDESEVVLDVSLARGLAYYTGPVFEVELVDSSVGSVGAGGRYDDLVGRFSGQPWPGVGVSVGVDRLVAGLAELAEGGGTGGGRARHRPEVVVTCMDRKRLPEYVAIARELRAAGLSVDLFSGGGGSFAKQLRQADRLGAPVVVIAGGDELKKGVVTLKRMDCAEPDSAESREEWLAARSGQREIERAALVEGVRAALAEAVGAAGEGRSAGPAGSGARPGPPA